MNSHAIKLRELMKNLKSSINNGLTEAEAQKRLTENGENILKEKKKPSFIILFFSQFKDFMIIILVLAAAVSLITGIISGEGDFADPVIIMAIVVLNGIIGAVQESKAEKAIEALKTIYSPTAKVLRGGSVKEIPTKNIVVGDIVYLAQGDVVPADCRIVESSCLKVSEAALTGESMAVEKRECVLSENTPLAERENMVYMGTSVMGGRGKAVVTAVGMNTEIGLIANMLMDTVDDTTPLQKKLSETGKILGLGALGICFIIFFIGVAKHIPVFNMFMTSVSLAVAAIPEGLPAIVTVMLSIGVQRMAKQKAVIRRLPAVETLGCATVICSDKTGTLTQNNMSVAEIKGNKDLIKYAVLCTDSTLSEKGDVVGEPTENAIVKYALEKGIDKNESENNMPRIDEVPFDSSRKLMTTLHRHNGEYIAVTKGAWEVLLKKCSYYTDNENKKPMSQKAAENFSNINREMSEKALRVLAVAYKIYSTMPEKINESHERDLIFCGFIGLSDPPRPEARSAVDICKRAGIKPVMITGDNPVTARAIGEKIGLIGSNDGILTGSQIQEMTPEELENSVYKYKIYARVSPEHKVRIVRAFKAKGEIVAMTGDGVNDAPALKAADIGCAMGISGTEVAKGAADMVLTDDNFATIVTAVKEGRGIYANIKKAVHFLLSSNIGEIITVFMGMVIGFASPLAAIQLLWVNLVTDSMPAIALGLDPCHDDVMAKKPVNSKNLFTKDVWWDIILQGCMIGMLALLGYTIGKVYFHNETVGRTMCFGVLSISQLVHAYNMRNEGSVFEIKIFENMYLNGAFLLGTLMQIAVIQIDALNNLFKVTRLTAAQWLAVTVLCLVPVGVVELQKWVKQ